MSGPRKTSSERIATLDCTISTILCEAQQEDAHHPSGLDLLLLHSNSASSQAFESYLDNLPPHIARIIAIDLPGHGLSTDAQHNPKHTYTQRGMADAALEVLETLKISQIAILGHSLGGHVAIEMLALLEAPSSKIECKGIMIIGTPPALGKEQVTLAFDPKDGKGTPPQAGAPPARNLFAAEQWTEEECRTVAFGSFGPPFKPWMVDTARRTDGKARKIMYESFLSGKVGVDQQAVVRDCRAPIAVVNGGAEPFVNLDYLDRLQWGNLWEGKCHRIPGAKHCVFWEDEQAFRPYLDRWLEAIV